MAGGAAIAEAFRLLQAGRPQEALDAARRIAGAEPSHARAHMAAGLALRMLGRAEESRSALERAAALDPRDYGAAYEHGVALSLAGRPAEALACFRRAAELRPGFAPAHFALGMNAFARADWPAAIAALEAAARLDPSHAELHLNLGLAYAEANQDARAEQTLREAAARFPAVAQAKHALGWALHKARRAAEALPLLEAALAQHDDPRWRLDFAKALADAGRDEEAREQFARAVAASPGEAHPRIVFGRFSVARADFDRAAELFGEAAALDRGHLELPMYVAQVELLRGRWREGWRAYAGREQRVLYEAEARRRGRPYLLPSPAELSGAALAITGEQGLGDELFFLRFAPELRARGARLAYAGDRRLAPLLARTGLFEAIAGPDEALPGEWRPVLTGDLPLVLESESTPPSLEIRPDPARLEAMRRRLERAGPRPWVGVTWRAGTPRQVVSHALHKVAPIPGLFAAMPRAGTVISLQRDGHFDELESASNALLRPIYDFSGANADLEDALALVALLDRHVGVSNTNMHLAAAAGATAEVLVPFPPEWRWGLAEASPWFPGFGIHRQAPDGDWSRAYAVLAQRMARQ